MSSKAKAPKAEKIPKIPSAGKLSALERKEAKKKSKDDLTIYNNLNISNLDEFGDEIGR
jgi:hypothetical protein